MAIREIKSEQRRWKRVGNSAWTREKLDRFDDNEAEQRRKAQEEAVREPTIEVDPRDNITDEDAAKIMAAAEIIESRFLWGKTRQGTKFWAGVRNALQRIATAKREEVTYDYDD